MHTIKCPYCSKDVKIIYFGGGWVAVCCNRIIYNSRELPKDMKKK